MRKRDKKSHLRIIKPYSGVEIIGVYENGQLVGFTGWHSKAKKVKANINKINYFNKTLWKTQ